METIVEGLRFAEGPRWHDGALWFSDIHGGAVHRVRGGADEVVAELDEQPSGLGWLPDGDLLVVCMATDRVARIAPDGRVSTHADLAGIVRGSPNDMAVLPDGTAFVGDMGARMFDEHPDHSVPGQLLRIAPDGSVSVACDPMRAPNGMAVPPGADRLVVAESGGFRLVVFDVDQDAGGSSVGAPRPFAELAPASGAPFSPPDGICLDADAGVWAADPIGRRVVRVVEGGEVTDEHPFPEWVPVACVLGGADRRDLFVCVAETLDPSAPHGNSRILSLRADVPGIGFP